jgi:DNA adenine methylase
MIRFNRRGAFNVPFCRKNNRFAQAYITKITNQVEWVFKLLQLKSFSFICQSFTETLKQTEANDLIYCDPPYIDRHADYYNGWEAQHEQQLFTLLKNTPTPFILSTWHHNDYRKNPYIETIWQSFTILTREHFYYVGASEHNRSPMIEAIVTNLLPLSEKNTYSTTVQQAQLGLF